METSFIIDLIGKRDEEDIFKEINSSTNLELLVDELQNRAKQNFEYIKFLVKLIRTIPETRKYLNVLNFQVLFDLYNLIFSSKENEDEDIRKQIKEVVLKKYKKYFKNYDIVVGDSMVLARLLDIYDDYINISLEQFLKYKSGLFIRVFGGIIFTFNLKGVEDENIELDLIYAFKDQPYYLINNNIKEIDKIKDVIENNFNIVSCSDYNQLIEILKGGNKYEYEKFRFKV